MKHLPQFSRRGSLPVAENLAIFLIASTILAGCGQHRDASKEAAPTYVTTSVSTEPSVTLTPNQLSAIKIDTVRVSVFHKEAEAVGVVNFPEDPNIVQAVSTLLSSAATYAVAERELIRAKELVSAQGVSERELEQATSDEQTAKAALRAARSALLQLGKSSAEIDRIVATGKSDSSAALLRSGKWILANASETDSLSLQAGQPLRVEAEAIPSHEFSGKVAEVYAAEDPNLHHVTVRGNVDDPHNQLRPGMLVGVQIEVDKPVTSPAIPADGVVREGDGTMTAWITTDRQHFYQKHIDIGALEDGKVQILKGLEPGQLVVTDGAVLLDNVLLAPSGD
jgi:cobalt-zinc-cadmium efflux system membrane fusion protein